MITNFLKEFVVKNIIFFFYLQYMSLILVHSNEHQIIAEKSRTEEQNNRLPEVIITEIKQAETFYPAEE